MKLLIPSLACSPCGQPFPLRHFPVSPIASQGNHAQHYYSEHLNELFQDSQDALTLTTLLKGICLSGNVHKALHFQDKLLAHGFQFNQVTYGSLINGLCKTGQTTAAIQVLRKIPQYGIVPNVVMYSTIIDSLCKDTLVSRAFHFYSEMLAKGISPTVITYNTLIYGLCLAGQV
ncbi:hypothetical protein PIB30_045012 [Stylosanthes scabra]|uniref:Pentatricopeptide repeat-containing protein n=1 Tax=Stylosanthes scabra TaxID=79078 RepID=A0ABU6ZER6_9FABA|nr:hypothetical protein [Stylosanthes scabra]